MTNREIADAFMKGNYDGVRKLHEEKLEQQANKFTTIFIILSVCFLGAFLLVITAQKQNYKDELNSYNLRVQKQNMYFKDSLQNYCDTANGLHVFDKSELNLKTK